MQEILWIKDWMPRPLNLKEVRSDISMTWTLNPGCSLEPSRSELLKSTHAWVLLQTREIRIVRGETGWGLAPASTLCASSLSTIALWHKQHCYITSNSRPVRRNDAWHCSVISCSPLKPPSLRFAVLFIKAVAPCFLAILCSNILLRRTKARKLNNLPIC